MNQNTRYKRWPKEETRILIENYATNTKHEMLALLPGRTDIEIVRKANRLGLHKNARIDWSEEEITLLVEKYPTSTNEELAELFPNRGIEGICGKANRLGLHKIGDPAIMWWSEEEIALLIEKYPTSTKSELATIFPNKTTEAIWAKANRLGLCKNANTLLRANNERERSTWTEEEINILTEHHPTSTIEELTVMIPNHSKSAIQAQANILGLKKTAATQSKISSNNSKKFWDNNRKSVILRKGVRYVYKPDHPHANESRVAEHILIWEKTNNKPLPEGWRVSHKDGNKQNNAPDNLIAYKGKHPDDTELKFTRYGIKIGDIVSIRNKPEITATVIDDTHVSCNGEICTASEFIHRYNIHAPSSATIITHNDKTLYAIRRAIIDQEKRKRRTK